jgi:carbonic anhydrase
MDGRVQRKLADYLTAAFGARHLDTITTAGLIRHLADDTDQTETLLSNLETSIRAHGSNQVAVTAHHDCAGNPVSDATQKQQVATAVARLQRDYPQLEVIGIWLNDHWIVERVRP